MSNDFLIFLSILLIIFTIPKIFSPKDARFFFKANSFMMFALYGYITAKGYWRNIVHETPKFSYLFLIHLSALLHLRKFRFRTRNNSP